MDPNYDDIRVTSHSLSKCNDNWVIPGLKFCVWESCSNKITEEGLKPTPMQHPPQAVFKIKEQQPYHLHHPSLWFSLTFRTETSGTAKPIGPFLEKQNFIVTLYSSLDPEDHQVNA